MSEHEKGAPPNLDTNAPNSIGDLVAKVTDQFSRLIRGELELAQANLQSKFTRLGAGAGMFGAAGVLSLYAFGILLLAAVWGIAEALPLWAAALIVGFVLLLIAGVLALVGKKMLDASKQFQVDPKTGIMMDVEAAKKGIHK